MSNTKWWERFDKKWARIPYGDGSKHYFWTRNCGLFVIDVEPKGKGNYIIGVSSLDGSIDNCWHEEFQGNVSTAKAQAMLLGSNIVRGLHENFRY